MKKTCVPTTNFARNEFGLLCNDAIQYVYQDDGTINWRKMINPNFLVPNKQVFERRNKPTPEKIDGLADNELLILLGGIKELAQIRGFTSVEYEVTSPSIDYVVAVCRIKWIPNFETNGESITFSAIGDAHDKNTTSFGRYFLGPIAENRAFVRSVRNFLKVNIVSQEEIGGSSPSSDKEDAALTLLKEAMSKYGISEELIFKKLIEQKVEGAEKFTSLSEIPRVNMFELIERIKKKAEAKSRGQ